MSNEREVRVRTESKESKGLKRERQVEKMAQTGDLTPAGGNILG